MKQNYAFGRTNVLVGTIALLLVATLLLNAHAVSQTTPVTPKKVGDSPKPPSHFVQSQFVSNLVYQTQDTFKVKGIVGRLPISDTSVAVITLESARDVARGGLTQINQSFTLVKDETKQIMLSNPTSTQPVIQPCDFLVTLDASGSLAIGPAPNPPGQTGMVPQPGVIYPCTAGNMVLELRFHALVLLPQ